MSKRQNQKESENLHKKSSTDSLFKYSSLRDVVEKNKTKNFREEKEKEKEEEKVASLYFSMDLNKNEKVFEIPANTLAYSKEKETDYNCISYLTSTRKPDLYVGGEVIKAKFYKINTEKPKEEREEEKKISSQMIVDDKCQTSLEEMIHIIDRAGEEEDATKEILGEEGKESPVEAEEFSDKEDDIVVKKKERRYFDANDITKKCFNCDEYGHISKNCPYDLIIVCYRCNQRGHVEDDCPNTKCFKCNRIGHKSFECNIRSSEIEKCENCKNVGHTALDCLANPVRPRKRELKNSTCFFCGEKGHLICPKPKNPFILEVYDSEDVEVSDSEEGEYSDNPSKSLKTSEIKESKSKKKHKRVINYLSNKEIKHTIFCPKCAETHPIEECKVQLRFNVFDQRRQLYSKNFFNDERDRSRRRDEDSYDSRNKRRFNDSSDKYDRYDRKNVKKNRYEDDIDDSLDYFNQFIKNINNSSKDKSFSKISKNTNNSYKFDNSKFTYEDEEDDYSIKNNKFRRDESKNTNKLRNQHKNGIDSFDITSVNRQGGNQNNFRNGNRNGNGHSNNNKNRKENSFMFNKMVTISH